MAVLDGYIRVSRVGGREGDSFISPRVQREKIEAWARLHDAALGEVVEELDVSGGRSPGERKLGRLLRRCEAGRSSGIITWRVDRFSRSAADTLAAVKRLQDCGGRLVGVDDGVDTNSPGGKLILTVLAGLAESQLDASRENWRTARREARKRGVYLTGYTPTGYARIDGGGIVPDPDVAPVIEEGYRMRAAGESYRRVADFLAVKGVLPRSGSGGARGRERTGWSREGVRQLLANPLYKGKPAGANANAEIEAIVSRELWDAANFTTRAYPAGNGQTRSWLVGIAACGGCGHNLHSTGDSYACRGHYATGPCPARAVANVQRVDNFVWQQLVELPDDVALRVGQAEVLYLDATAAVERAEAELETYLSTALASVVGEQAFIRAVEVRQEALDDARRVLYELPEPELPSEGPVVDYGGVLLVTPSWTSLTVEEQRRWVRRYIQRIVIHRADPTRRKHQPIGERVEVIWR